MKKRPKRSKPSKKGPVKQKQVSKASNKKMVTTDQAEFSIRLNKYVANAGICSRRKADELIKEGRVTVNGTVIYEMGYRVQSSDEVQFDGTKIKAVQSLIYILLNKPRNVITTLNDEKGRRTVRDLIQDTIKERIYPVGRLDRNTTGLLIMTNDGSLAQKLSHPSYEVIKVYKATLNKKITAEHLNQIRNTLTLEDGPAPVDAVEMVDNNPKVIGIQIHIGRNRIVRRIFESLGYEVKKLDRVRYASLSKKNLPVGHFRHLRKEEIILLKHITS